MFSKPVHEPKKRSKPWRPHESPCTSFQSAMVSKQVSRERGEGGLGSKGCKGCRVPSRDHLYGKSVTATIGVRGEMNA